MVNRINGFLILVIFSFVVSCKSTVPKEYADINKAQNDLLNHTIDSLEKEINILKKGRPKFNLQQGRSYASCTSGPVLESTKKDCLVFTGRKINLQYMEEMVIQIKPDIYHWTVGNTHEMCEGCSETDVQDCVIWRSEMIPAIFDTVYIVTDTIEIKEFEIKTYDIYSIVKEAEIFPWGDFRCPHYRFPKERILQVQNALRENGYPLEGAIEDSMCPLTKKALADYQKRHKLPVGQLDLETLESLKIEK